MGRLSDQYASYGSNPAAMQKFLLANSNHYNTPEIAANELGIDPGYVKNYFSNAGLVDPWSWSGTDQINPPAPPPRANPAGGGTPYSMVGGNQPPPPAPAPASSPYTMGAMQQNMGSFNPNDMARRLQGLGGPPTQQSQQIRDMEARGMSSRDIMIAMGDNPDLQMTHTGGGDGNVSHTGYSSGWRGTDMTSLPPWAAQVGGQTMRQKMPAGGGLQSFYDQNKGNPASVANYLTGNHYTAGTAGKELGIDPGYITNYLKDSGSVSPMSQYLVNNGRGQSGSGGLQSFYDQNKGNPQAVRQYMQQNGYNNESAAKELGIDAGYVNNYFGGQGGQTSGQQQQPQGPASGGGNPYLSQQADDIGRRSQFGLGQAFNAIRSNAVGVGGLGGSRQGVAEGVATGMANDALTGNLANLYGTDWTNSKNRELSRYGMDQGFYTSQRGQDMQGVALGADMYDKGMNGEWSPLQNASKTYSPYTGLGTQTQTQNSGGGASGLVGGLLSGGQFAQNMGWWK